MLPKLNIFLNYMELLNVLCFKYISTITPTNVNIITNVTVYKPCILTKNKNRFEFTLYKHFHKKIKL